MARSLVAGREDAARRCRWCWPWWPWRWWCCSPWCRSPGPASERAAARTAADAAALAGAAEGEAAAREVAAANGAELVSWRAEGLDVWVVVALGDARAEAKARRDR